MSSEKSAEDNSLNTELTSSIQINDQQPQSQMTITELIGPFGWWQFNIAAFYFIAYILTPFNNLGITFHAAKTEYHCTRWKSIAEQPEHQNNVTKVSCLSETVDNIN